MSKKIVFSVLLSLLFGILGAKASIGGFPTYSSLGGLPYECKSNGDNYWLWITKEDADLKCKKNGKDVEQAYLTVEGGSSKATGVMIGFRLWGDFPGLKTSTPDNRSTWEFGIIKFSNGKELCCSFAISVERPYYAAFMFRTIDMKNQDWENLIRCHDVKKLAIGIAPTHVIEFQTPTHVTFAAMLNEWQQKCSPEEDFRPKYSEKQDKKHRQEKIRRLFGIVK